MALPWFSVRRAAAEIATLTMSTLSSEGGGHSGLSPQAPVRPTQSSRHARAVKIAARIGLRPVRNDGHRSKRRAGCVIPPNIVRPLQFAPLSGWSALAHDLCALAPVALDPTPLVVLPPPRLEMRGISGEALPPALGGLAYAPHSSTRRVASRHRDDDGLDSELTSLVCGRGPSSQAWLGATPAPRGRPPSPRTNGSTERSPETINSDLAPCGGCHTRSCQHL